MRNISITVSKKYLAINRDVLCKLSDKDPGKGSRKKGICQWPGH